MKKILFATNFSDSCDNAFHYIKTMIGRKSVIVDLVHVFDIPPTILTTIPHNAIEGMIMEKRKVVNRKLGELRDRLNKKSRGKIISVYGVYPSAEISDLANDMDYELVVMAMRQKYSFIDRLMGTVTAQTILRAEVPVLAVPNGAEFRAISHVVFPTAISTVDDLKEEEENALNKLCEFLRFSKEPEITLVHITENKENVSAKKPDVTFVNSPISGFKYTWTFAPSVDKGILDFLKKDSADLLAFYRPHRSFWERLYHSSVTRKLLFQCRVPLLIF